MSYYGFDLKCVLKVLPYEKEDFDRTIAESYKKCYFSVYWYSLKYFLDDYTKRLCNLFNNFWNKHGS